MLRFGGTPAKQWASRTSQRGGPKRPQDQNVQEEAGGLRQGLVRRAPIRAVVHPHNRDQTNRGNPVLPGLWSRSSPSSRGQVSLRAGPGVRRGAAGRHAGDGPRAGGGTPPGSRAASGKVPTGATTISCPQYPPQDPRGRRPRTQAGPLQGRAAQALSHVGGPVQGCSCFQAWLRALGNSIGGADPERVEHPAPPEVLPLKGPEPVKKANACEDRLFFWERPRACEEGECL